MLSGPIVISLQHHTGMDAKVSYAFKSERKLHPEKFKNQLVNQVKQIHMVGVPCQIKFIFDLHVK